MHCVLVAQSQAKVSAQMVVEYYMELIGIIAAIVGIFAIVRVVRMAKTFGRTL